MMPGNTRPGKHTKNYGKSLFLMGKSTVLMASFVRKLLVYQRVHGNTSSLGDDYDDFSAANYPSFIETYRDVGCHHLPRHSPACLRRCGTMARTTGGMGPSGPSGPSAMVKMVTNWLTCLDISGTLALHGMALPLFWGGWDPEPQKLETD
jgi:hypothetical protein